MQKNFRIAQSIYLEFSDVSFDIHNDFNFDSLELNTKINRLQIRFVKAVGKWVAHEIPREIFLKFSNLKYIFFSEHFFTKNNIDIEEMGYKEPQEKEIDFLIQEQNFLPEYHLIIRFENDEYLRIYCESAEVLMLSKLT